jgi:NADH-quinone oxidoreductase subunit N
MAVMMFSLAGIPPLAGFWGKLTLFTSSVSMALTGDEAGVRMWFVLLAVAGGLNAAVAAAYYLRIISVMYFRPVAGQPARAEGGLGSAATIGICAAAVVLLGLMPGWLLRPTTDAKLYVNQPAAAAEAGDVALNATAIDK